MSESTLTVFSNGVASYLSSCVFPAIVQGFAQKGVNTSVEELMMMTSTPAVRTSPSVPSMAFGGGGAVPSMAASISPSSNSRKTAVTDQPVPGRTCMYKFKRGDNKDKYCGKPTAAPGQDYCSACLKNRKNLGKDVAARAAPGTAPAMGAIPGMGGMPPNYGVPAAAQPEQNGALSVTIFDEARGLYKENNYGFIVKEHVPGTIMVIGKHDEVTNIIGQLTPQDQALAKSMGLVIANDTPSFSPSPVPVTAPVNSAAIPTMPAMPAAIPSGIPNAIPSGVPSGIPAIPSGVPSGIPAIPSAVPSGIPAIPTALPAMM